MDTVTVTVVVVVAAVAASPAPEAAPRWLTARHRRAVATAAAWRRAEVVADTPAHAVGSRAPAVSSRALAEDLQGRAQADR